MLWASDVHDGPITGVAARGARHYWFAARFDSAEDEFEFPRRLVLYEMTDDEFADESAIHSRFEEIVGNLNYCFHLSPQERINSSGEKGRRLADFYDDERNKGARDFETRRAVGWFYPPKRNAR
jgi:hypothetical protein